jgi:hypothetical protein
LTGLSWESARFQARSAFTGTGFTTAETEHVVVRPVRRNIIMWLMIARSAGLISIIISLILSFGANTDTEMERLVRLAWLIAGVAMLWVLARSKYVGRWMGRVIKRALNRYTDLEVRDYSELLKLAGEYTVREMKVRETDWLTDKKLRECRLYDEGILVLGIHRADSGYLGAPRGNTTIHAGDRLILYGRQKSLKNLDGREAGARGEAEHEHAIDEQKKEEAQEAKKRHA